MMGRTVDVRSFGALGDGVTLDTEAIQRAIDSLESGDTLCFSGGCFVTGSIALKGNMTLQIDPDAEVCGSRNYVHYRDCGFYHNEFHETVSLIYALNADNITVTGGGKIQLSGDAFMDFAPLRLPREIDPASVTREQIEQTVAKPRKRPTQPIFFDHCRNVCFDGVRIFNAPSWTLIFSNCENVTVRGLYIDNHARIPNNDGLHFTASRNITVEDCILLCADDCVAATCITNWESVCENIEIRDCLMSSRSAAIRFGHLSSHVRNATVKNVKLLPSNRAIAIFAGNGGCVENIHVEALCATTQTYSGFWWGKGEGFVICADNSDGRISNITIRDCQFKQENPSVIAGMDRNVTDVTLEHCAFSSAEPISHPYYRRKLDLQPNIKSLTALPEELDGPVYVKEGGCQGLCMTDVSVS